MFPLILQIVFLIKPSLSERGKHVSSSLPPAYIIGYKSVGPSPSCDNLDVLTEILKSQRTLYSTSAFTPSLNRLNKLSGVTL